MKSVEQQRIKYKFETLRIFGIALMTPLGSQFFNLKDFCLKNYDAYDVYVFSSFLALFLLGFLLIALGYNVIREEWI